MTGDETTRPHVVQVIPDLGVGGAERMLLNLATELRRTHRVTVVSLWPPIEDSTVEAELARAGVEVLHLFKRPGVDLAIFGRLASTLDELRPDVLHTHRMAVRYALPYTWRRSIPHVHTVHTLAQHEGTRGDRMILGGAYRSGRVVAVACGPLVADSLSEVYRIDAPVLDNGIAQDFFGDWDRPDRIEALRLVCVARLAEVKNHDLLLRAVALATGAGADLTLDLAGDGPLRPQLEEQVRELGLEERVRFHGQVRDVPAVLRTADVSVLTSRYEGAPLSVMEAMAMGVPVLAPSVGGLPHLLAKGGGWLFDGSLDALVGELTRLASSPGEVDSVAGAGREVARQRYSAAAMAAAYGALYRRSACRDSTDEQARGGEAW